MWTRKTEQAGGDRLGKNYALLTSYVAAHFVVDFACALLIYQMVLNEPHWYISLLLYNFCAFALQMPAGLLADRINRNSCCAALGCGLVALAYVFGNYAVPAVIIAGLGNGLFHVGGGIDVLNASERKPVLLGLFVSPGAFGIYLGTLLGKKGGVPLLLVAGALILVMLWILTAQYGRVRGFRSANVLLSFQGIASFGTLAAIGSLFLVVILRSYVGMNSDYSWRSSASWAAVYTGAVVLGKVGGGILALLIGVRRASILSLAAAAACFLFAGFPAIGVAAVFFFNMTMPLTLWAVGRILTGAKGFSFGLLTFGLFLGFVPSYLELPRLFSNTAGFCAVSVLSLLLLLYGLRRTVV